MAKKIKVSELDEDATLVTSDALGQSIIEQAVHNYQSRNHFYSSYYNNETSTNGINITPKDIDNLAYNAQNNLSNILKINQIVRYYINKDDLIGRVHEAIETNVNTDYEMKFPNYTEEEKETYDEVENLIKDFLKKIGIKNLIVKSITSTFDEGNFGMYLRKNSINKEYKIDYYPLGVLEVSDYLCDGEPYLLIDIKELKKRLRKTNKKNRNGKSLFFDSIDEEIKENYPIEVYNAFKNNDNFAKLNIKNTGMLRVNNINRKYGLSPYFKAIKPCLRLEEIEESDDKNLKARGKKIIHQVLRKELFDDSNKTNVKWHEGTIVAHERFIEAWKYDPVVYTSFPWVEKIEYVEPKIEPTNINTINLYRSKITTALGIGFLISEKGAYASAQINIDQLMKMIDKIAQQLEDILKKWCEGVLIDNGFDLKYCPDIKVCNAELMKMELKLKFADILFNKFGMSFKSTYEMLGRNYETEKLLRQKENKESLDKETFYPRQTSYTYTGDNEETTDEDKKAGRPTALKDGETKNMDKVVEDKERRNEDEVDSK